MLAIAVFFGGSVISLATSWVLVSRVERLGGHLRMPEAVLGVVAALAADAPEITAAVSAMIGHDQQAGAGVVLGSNVFNLAALLGLSALVAGRVNLHRNVVLLGGAVAVWVALVSALVVAGWLPISAGLVLAAIAVATFVALAATHGRRLPGVRMPRRFASWMDAAVRDEELELAGLIPATRSRSRDWAVAGVALVVVIAASAAMEQAAIAAGRRYAVPEIVIGGLVLAAVTSLPNAVAAVYLARRGRGAATLSTALNSNALNVIFGLLLPGALTGLRAASPQAVLVTWWYLVLTCACVALAYRYRGVGRRAGSLIIGGYIVFACSVTASGYRLAGFAPLAVVLAVSSAALLAPAAWPARLAARLRLTLREPAGIWATSARLAFVTAVTCVAAAATGAATAIRRITR